MPLPATNSMLLVKVENKPNFKQFGWARSSSKFWMLDIIPGKDGPINSKNIAPEPAKPSQVADNLPGCCKDLYKAAMSYPNLHRRQFHSVHVTIFAPVSSSPPCEHLTLKLGGFVSSGSLISEDGNQRILRKNRFGNASLGNRASFSSRIISVRYPESQSTAHGQ